MVAMSRDVAPGCATHTRSGSAAVAGCHVATISTLAPQRATNAVHYMYMTAALGVAGLRGERRAMAQLRERRVRAD